MPKIGMKQILIAMGALTIVYAVLLYFSSKPVIQDVSSKEPYASFVNKTVSLQEEVLVYLNREELRLEANYVMANINFKPFDPETKQYALPIGQEIRLTKAVVYEGDLTGFKVALFVGETFIPELNENISFEYFWGNEVKSILQDAPLRLNFEKAPWQREVSKGLYTF
jgi:hypothetical protein